MFLFQVKSMMQNWNNFIINEINIAKTVSCFSENWEIFALKSGKATVVNGGNVYELESGGVAFFPPDTVHNFTVKDGSEYILLSFKAEGELLELLKEKVAVVRKEELSLLDEAVDLIENNHNTLSTTKGFTMVKLFFLLCCEKDNLKISKHKSAETFMSAAVILQENIKSNISVNELADRLYVSLSNLKRTFVNLVGIGVHEYHTFLKIAKAKQLLSEGNSVTETAALTGFANQAYFSAAFKRVNGTSPKSYLIQRENKIKNTTPKRNAKSKSDLPSYLL